VLQQFLTDCFIVHQSSSYLVVSVSLINLHLVFRPQYSGQDGWPKHLGVWHTRNPSRVENALNELGAVVENQVVMPSIRNSIRHCLLHRSGLVCRNRDVEIRMRRDLAAGAGMCLKIVFWVPRRSPE
jgi:hypothetical protein